MEITVYPEKSALATASIGNLGYKYDPLAKRTTFRFGERTRNAIYQTVASLLEVSSDSILLIKMDEYGVLREAWDRAGELEVVKSLTFFQCRKPHGDRELQKSKRLVLGKFLCLELDLPIQVLDPMELGVGCPRSDLFPVAAKQLGFPSDTQFNLFEDPCQNHLSPMETAPLSLVFQLKQGHPLPTSSREWQQRLTTIPIDHWAGPPAVDVECTFHPSVSMNNWRETNLVFVYEYNNSATPKRLVRVPRSLGLPGFREFVRRILGLEGLTVLFYHGPFGNPHPISQATVSSNEIAFRIVEDVAQNAVGELITVVAIFSEDSYRVSRRTSILAQFGSTVMNVRTRLEDCGFLPVNTELFIACAKAPGNPVIIADGNMIIDRLAEMNFFEIRFDVLTETRKKLIGRDCIVPVRVIMDGKNHPVAPFWFEIPDMTELVRDLLARIVLVLDIDPSNARGLILEFYSPSGTAGYGRVPVTWTVQKALQELHKETACGFHGHPSFSICLRRPR
jgi:hypothetical protein